jgi:hypothetical protein
MYLDNYKPKNEIVSHIVKNFFNKEEVDEILKIVKNQQTDESIDQFYKPLILQNMSRMQIEIIYPETIKKKLEEFASNLAGEELIMSHNSYLSYNKIHGDNINPKLPPHFDSDNYYSKVTLDYQLSKNIDWPIRIEEDEFNLEYGDLLVFWGSGTIHWREPVFFNDGDNTEVLTMHFSKKEDYEKLNIIARDPEERQKRLDSWILNSNYNQYHIEYADKDSKLK